MSAPEGMPPELGDRLTAAMDLLRRTGASEVQIRYDDDPQPTVWMVVVTWRVNKDGRPVPHGAHRSYDAAAGMDPVSAAERLLDEVVTGGTCKHCGRPGGVEQDWRLQLPWADRICWYTFDPELKKYRRSCEGDTG